MKHDMLNEQIAYYRARAQEYDESVGGTEEAKGTFARAIQLLQHMGPFEQVLELACGTGIWTSVLLQIGQHITAIDAAPEMLDIAQRKLGNAPVHYQQANLFEWEPVQQYDLVFFAFWLSHIPPERWKISFPPGVVVSIFSVTLIKSTPRSSRYWRTR